MAPSVPGFFFAYYDDWFFNRLDVLHSCILWLVKATRLYILFYFFSHRMFFSSAGMSKLMTTYYYITNPTLDIWTRLKSAPRRASSTIRDPRLLRVLKEEIIKLRTFRSIGVPIIYLINYSSGFWCSLGPLACFAKMGFWRQAHGWERNGKLFL